MVAGEAECSKRRRPGEMERGFEGRSGLVFDVGELRARRVARRQHPAVHERRDGGGGGSAARNFTPSEEELEVRGRIHCVMLHRNT